MDPELQILIVEDNQGDYILIRELLNSSGFIFLSDHASTLAETLKLCINKSYDLILLDLGLPDSFGIESLKKIHASCLSSAIIVMTGLDDEKTALETLREGALDYLVKNRLNVDTVWRSIKYSIERKKAQDLLKKSEDSYRELNKELEQKVKDRTKDLEDLNNQLQKELSERIAIEAALRRNEKELKELNATKDKFFNIVAHDLKNPFTSLLGSSELLFQNIDFLDQKNIKKLAIILNDSAKSGYAILQNLLDWSRSQTGLLKINPEPLKLKALVDENIANQELFYTNKEITIHSEVFADLQIFADKNMTNTVLRNLISNALKFSHRNGEVFIKAIEDHDFVIVSVKDFGVGIAAEDTDKLFRIDTKFSLPGTENEQGTGLGLKLSKEFVEKQGGRLWLISEENKGSEFLFSVKRN